MEAANIRLVSQTNFIFSGTTNTLPKRGNTSVGPVNINSVKETELIYQPPVTNLFDFKLLGEYSYSL
jgi:hypothetical protein